jgi:hypothetical protein
MLLPKNAPDYRGNAAASLIIENADSSPMRWQRLRERIEQDILNGTFSASEPIPSNKMLQSRYNVSYPTLRKALDSLVEENILQVFHRWYRIAPITVMSRTSLKIVLLAAMDTGKKQPALTVLGEEFLRTIEAECSRSRIEFQLITYEYEKDIPVYADYNTKRRCKLPADDSIAGYLFPIASPYVAFKPALLEVIAAGKPVAVYDELGNTVQEPEITRHKLVKHFVSASGKAPGLHYGRFLRTLGHKNIAFFSPFHGELWSQHRLEGLRQCYRPEDNCSCFAYTVNKKPQEYDTDKFHNPDLEMIRRACEAFEKQFPLLSHYITESVIGRAGFYRWMAPVFAGLHPLFEDAHKNRSITAWVAVNELTATLAMDFLNSTNVRIPRDLSLVSFDDTGNSIKKRITSYNFNITAVARAMLAYVMKSDYLAVFKKPRPIIIEGMIVERATTTRAGI